MPDSARLIAAACVGALGFLVSFLIIPLMPESTYFGYFVWINLALGVCAGWIVMGKRAGRGVTAAINNGLGGTMTLVVWGLFVYACYEMFSKAMDNWYKNPFDALIAVFELMAKYGLVLVDPAVLMLLIGGGIVSGLFTELAWRNWR
ncbi:TrgA family protein [Sulfitobacter sp. D35]|uniref:TrgA family protein n=1 Tax=Sulfitobacter sp. D35 TaxID=3083252 RepID=UPI00296E53FB|nr:TrgA family protein [Sulfitobacter sp. D35]MDW4496407.1 TrgA family protein [Sulfitobacter sp. D35]